MENIEKNIPVKKATVVKKKIAIVTCCTEDWGGSEDLWWKTALHLNSDGIDIMILKNRINRYHHRFIELSKKNILLHELDTLPRKNLTKRLFIKAWNKLKSTGQNHFKLNFEKHLRHFQPDLVLISQGINFDGLIYARSCMAQNIPYAMICHKAVEFYWPQPYERTLMLEAFQKARKCFFVSRHNQQLTEEQFGIRFSNAAIVRNPVNAMGRIIPYPSTKIEFKLACIGRLFIIDKGQDILLRVLAQQKWKERPLYVSFIGRGVDEQALKEMASLLNVTNVEFKGQIDNMEEVWKEHHALILPSRSEGLALVILEAFSAGRMVISTKAGGSAEVIRENETGFLGEATVTSVDSVLEKAWQHRNSWKEMSENAFQYALKNISTLPEIDFANALTSFIYER
jgi:glycosyltransferase involved in cell wall biosynthesis